MENGSPRDVIAHADSTAVRLHADGFITIRDAQERLGRSRSFLARATRAGALPRYRIGYGRGRVVLAIEDVDALAVPRPADPEAGGLPRRTPTPRDGGFTLLELLVTVLIIGVLAGIAVPVFRGQQTRAREAAIREDLRNAARSVEDYWGGDAPSWDAIRTATGVATTSPTTIPLATRWSAVPGTESIRVSDSKTVLGLVTAPIATGAWSRAMAPGDVCIIATNRSSRWNYTSGSGALAYDRAMYYDGRAGGVRTIAALARALQDGQDVACLGFARQYISAGGVY